MLKMAEAEEVALNDDPRPMDAARWQRLRVLVDKEAINPTWGCPLYIAARPGGWLSNEQREAGDKYQQITIDYNRAQETDPDDSIPEARDLLYKRIERYKRRWKEAVNVLGRGRKLVDILVLEELHLSSEAERLVVRDALQLLANYFSKGTKRVHRTP